MIILALVLLTLSVAAELAGPFVAKNIIDHHILGIQSHWYETKKGKDSVKFQGNWYKREDYFSANEEKGEKATILQDGVSFIFTKEPISLDAKIKLEGNRLTADGQTYKVTILSPNEVMNFYKPEIPRIIRLILYILAY